MREATISAAARQAGVGIETIRFYERRGLIKQPPKPQGSGFRVYSSEQIKRIQFIRRAQQLGFSLREIRDLLSLRADPQADCSDVRAQALAKLDEVALKIEQLREIEAALKALIAVCPGRGGVQACSILDTLGEPDRGVAPAIESRGPLMSVPPKRTRRRSGRQRTSNNRRRAT